MKIHRRHEAGNRTAYHSGLTIVDAPRAIIASCSMAETKEVYCVGDHRGEEGEYV